MTSKPRLLDQVRHKLRLKYYSYRTEQSDIAWTKRFIFFCNKQHPDTMGEREVESFLIYLAVKRNVAASTQNQVLCALLFYIRKY
ncbi:site-specific integrase [Nitrosomonas sp. Nm58]|uniref:site-specific integrase n=1 Tax=Nitrosomonas sp. Nm58 TaxID=200126 RepID=UPI000894D1E3|nr:site-specific integrase [Nitrosomonas sp. Nm58]SDY01730.1 Phage integrase, N-terminal SAM-like domain [Nitrosomonas sp. Nm58]